MLRLVSFGEHLIIWVAVGGVIGHLSLPTDAAVDHDLPRAQGRLADIAARRVPQSQADPCDLGHQLLHPAHYHVRTSRLAVFHGTLSGRTVSLDA